jgi:hypothetical protein
MGLLGNKPPMMKLVNGQVYIFSTPRIGESKNPYEFIGKSYTNIDGENIKGERKWRYKKKYGWLKLDSTLYDILVTLYNSGQPVTWFPHSDVTFLGYKVHIEDLTLVPYDGLVSIDDVSFTVESVSPVTKIPSLDNMITGYVIGRRGV